MPIRQFELVIETRQKGTYELTSELNARLSDSRIRIGLCHIFVCHTSASLMLCENADSDVRRDLEALFSRLIPDGDPLFTHQNEGPDDMPAHARSVLIGSEVTVPIREGRLALGTWQGVFLWEHRQVPRCRRIIVTLQGD